MTGGSSRVASCSRPCRPNRSLTGTGTPASAQSAWTWHLSRERIRTSEARIRTSRRSSRTSGGAIQASGSRFVRRRWARVARVDRVVLDPPRADRLGREGMGHVGLDPGVGEEVGEPAPAVRRLEGDRDRLGLELAEDPPERVRAVLEASREDRVAGLVEGHHVADLAVQVHSEVHHCLGLPSDRLRLADPHQDRAISIGAEARSFMASRNRHAGRPAAPDVGATQTGTGTRGGRVG